YVVAPEQPGFGRSDALASLTNFSEQYAEAIHQILIQEKLDAAKPIIMAQSFGGHAAHGYLKKYPHNISCLILTDAVMPTIPVPNTWRIIWIQIILRGLGGTLLPLIPRNITRWIIRTLWRKYTLVWDAVEVHPKRLRSMTYHLVSSLYRSLLTQLPSMEVDYSICPVIMLWGERDGEEHTIVEGGGITHIRIARKLYKKIKQTNPRVKFIILRGGHTILYDNPSYVVEKIVKAIG
ncbi:MAG: hypothetical protein G01um101466_203, partial [Parcubacteria group bacterium Gr01-1014_66]